jgi:hypothetical protein
MTRSAVDNPLIQGRPEKLKKLKDCSKKFRDKGTVVHDIYVFLFIIKDQTDAIVALFVPYNVGFDVTS